MVQCSFCGTNRNDDAIKYVIDIILTCDRSIDRSIYLSMCRSTTRAPIDGWIDGWMDTSDQFVLDFSVRGAGSILI